MSPRYPPLAGAVMEAPAALTPGPGTPLAARPGQPAPLQQAVPSTLREGHLSGKADAGWVSGAALQRAVLSGAGRGGSLGWQRPPAPWGRVGSSPAPLCAGRLTPGIAAWYLGPAPAASQGQGRTVRTHFLDTSGAGGRVGRSSNSRRPHNTALGRAGKGAVLSFCE